MERNRVSETHETITKDLLCMSSESQKKRWKRVELKDYLKKKKLAEKDFEGLNNLYFRETAIVTMFMAQ